MTTQTEAERLADEISNKLSWVSNLKAAAELRRLVSLNNDLMDEVARLNKAPDYAWPTIADYEKEVGFEVNDAFKAAWTMARTTNDLFKQMGSDT